MHMAFGGTREGGRLHSFIVLIGFFLQAPTAPGGASTDSYTLGPGDQIIVFAKDLPDIDPKIPFFLDTRGAITLPIAGRIQAGGMTTPQLENEIRARLRKYLINPDVAVSITQMRSQPISVLGAVKKPGVYQIEGRKTLTEALSLAEGLREDAGYRVTITRKRMWGRLPLRNAKDDETGQFSVAAVSVKEIMAAVNPADNIEIKPDDVISVPRADIIYAIGAVKKPGGYVMNENETLTTLQVLALAEGLGQAAATSDGKILRALPGSNNRSEIPVDLKRILTGKLPDIPLKADDILFVPTSGPKNAFLRATEAAIQMGTGVVVYRR